MKSERNYQQNPSVLMNAMIPPATVFQIKMATMTLKANFLKRRRRQQVWKNETWTLKENMPNNENEKEKNCITKTPKKSISTIEPSTSTSTSRVTLTSQAENVEDEEDDEEEEEDVEIVNCREHLDHNDNNKTENGKSVCLLCRQVMHEECCWHCNENSKQQKSIHDEKIRMKTKTSKVIHNNDDIKYYLKRCLRKIHESFVLDIKYSCRHQRYCFKHHHHEHQHHQHQQQQHQHQNNCYYCHQRYNYQQQQKVSKFLESHNCWQQTNLSNDHNTLALCCQYISLKIKNVYITAPSAETTTTTSTLNVNNPESTKKPFDEQKAKANAATTNSSPKSTSSTSSLSSIIAPEQLKTEQHQQKQQLQEEEEVHLNINPFETGTKNNANNQKIQTEITAKKTTRKSANNIFKITNNNKKNNKNTNHSNKRVTRTQTTTCIRIARNVLRTFQFLVFYIHLQLLQCPIINNRNKYDKNSINRFSSNSLNSEIITTTTTTTNHNNSVHSKFNKIKSNNRQQSPPKQRLILHHQQQQQQQPKQQQHRPQQKQRQQQNHNVQMQQEEEKEQKFHQNYYYHYHRKNKMTQLRYFKMPNLSLLYKILIILSFLSIFLPSTTQAHQQFSQLALPTFGGSSSASLAASAALPLPVAGPGPGTAPIHPASSYPFSSSSLGLSSKTVPSSSTANATPQVRLSRNETVCKSLDLRNTPNEFRQLENCTVIEGFLVMTLVNTQSSNEFTESYPLLTEVTDFIVVYRVHNLRSLSQIFPNLSVIRGGVLHEGYALVVYSNPHLEDLGLSKLTTISRGGVRIENNLWLCYVETIDWSLIVTNTTDIVIQNNRAAIECPLCPDDPKAVRQDADGAVEGDAICREYHGKRHCWNSKMCQKICPDDCPNNCVDEKTCCNPACISGCSPNNLNVCTSCRYFSIYNSTCIEECPPNYYKFLDRRCLTADACTRMGTKYENNKQETLVAFNGTCSTRCPNGYIKEGSKCVACGNKCTKKCEGGLIDSVSAAKGLHGCTHIIKEGLTISIKRGGRHLMEDLEFGLSSIQVIDTYLKVHLTFGMFSLEFFKSLKVIRGEALCEDKFALYVLENNDLETLWGPNQTVEISNGRVFFHFNPKLCYSTIDALRTSMKNDTKFDKNEVALDSNGYKGSCNPEYLNTTVLSTSATNARILIVNPLKFDDDRTFIGYQYFYMEDRYGNATKHRHRPCDDSWFVSEPTKEVDFIIPSLTPFTQYAYYIKTLTISSEPRNAQSPIQYFKTKSSQPKSVRKLDVYSNSSSEIILSWLPPTHVYGNLSKYIVRAKLDSRIQKSASRNYCKDPVKGSPKLDTSSISKPSTEKPLETVDCNCSGNRDKNSNIENEADDANRHDVIEFENALQNFIYVKHPNSSSVKKENSSDTDDGNKRRQRRSYEMDTLDGDSFLVRHMRALPLPRETPNNIMNLSSTTMKPFENKTINVTHMDPKSQYFEVEIDATITKYVFKNLKHFSSYMVEVEACREPEVGAKDKECSEVLSTYARTLKMENVDKVENLRATLELNNTRPNVRLRWDPPERPNGAIVSYTIIYMVQAKDAVEEKKCITEQDYRNMTNGYLLTGLQMGSNYSIQVRANSLADEGVVSEAIFIQTPKPGMPLWLIIFLVIMLILCLIAGAIGWHCYRTRKNIAPTDLRFYPSVNPYYMTLQYEPDSWEVARERVIQLNPLGQGSFGMVYEGILKGLNSNTEDIPCAIKTVNENATDRERLNFLNEAGVMKQFDTYHVVKLLGVCSQGQPALVVMELMKNGDLKSYLRAHRPYDRDDEIGTTTTTAIRDGTTALQPPPVKRIYQMAIEIADGMAYLAAKKFVHRDLAARNCMVAADLTVKIGDFGMTRDIYETDYYRKGTKGLLPVRWMPPESLRDGVYSSASDVFSYGVVLWEMATLASQPYQGLSNDQVLRYVIDGGVMERPENCPDDLYDLMQRCWMHRPSARPTFMEIITFLLDHSNKQFAEVSFYHSEVGQQFLIKERAELQHSGDVFHDHDNDMDDATTPLRMGEYNVFPLNGDGNSSVENHGDSPMVIEDPTHSPYSIGSANIVSSTPDGGQSKHSFTASQNNPILSSAPSTSAAVMGNIGGGVGSQSQPHSYPRQVLSRYQPSNRHALPMAASVEDNAPYVQPDQWIIDEATQHREKKDSNNAPPTSRSAESATDERGYEMFDPSPNFREHASYDTADDEDFDGIGGSLRASKLSGGQNLLPRQKSRQRLPIIMPMSSSVPDEVINAPMSSSVASSNASSNATATAGSSIGGGTVGGSKYPASLKRAVAETVQNVGNTLMPTRLRNINRRFFSHKRTGSNTSHKSTSSNPTSANSNTNLTTATGTGTMMNKNQNSGQQQVGSIESGTGSYTATPRFFTPALDGDTSSSTTPPIAIMTDNPNYTILDETTNASVISSAPALGSGGGNLTPTHKNNIVKPANRPSGFTTSTNPNYQLLDESLNTTGPPTEPVFSLLSENPNYSSHSPPTNTSYVMMNEPNASETRKLSTAVPKFSDNPNYQMLSPQSQLQPKTQTQTQTKHHLQPPPAPTPPSTAMTIAGQTTTQPTSAFSHLWPGPSSSDDDDRDDDRHTEHIKMERMPLSRRTPQKHYHHQHQHQQQQQQQQQLKKRSNSRSRSRSKSRTKSIERSMPIATTTAAMITTIPSVTTASTAQTKPSQTFSLKEKWLRQQQQQQPPPNGFIGREG